MTVYRTSTTTERARRLSSPDGAEVFILAIMLVASGIRAIGAALRHETFGAEATLATLVLAATLVAAMGAVVRSRKRDRT